MVPVVNGEYNLMEASSTKLTQAPTLALPDFTALHLEEIDCIQREQHSLTPRSDLSSPRMPELVPSRLAPKMRLPKMLQLWTFLDRIEYIAVNDVYTTTEDDESCIVQYVLDVYCYQEQQGVPTHGRQTTESRPLSPPLRRPDFQVHHRFSSFVQLQRRIVKATQRKHRRLPRRYRDQNSSHRTNSSYRSCTYCQQIHRFVASGRALGMKTKLFTTVEMRKTLLTTFMMELLVFSRLQRGTCSNLELLAILHQPAMKYVEKSVPGILRKFLTAQTGETFMR